MARGSRQGAQLRRFPGHCSSEALLLLSMSSAQPARLSKPCRRRRRELRNAVKAVDSAQRGPARNRFSGEAGLGQATIGDTDRRASEGRVLFQFLFHGPRGSVMFSAFESRQFQTLVQKDRRSRSLLPRDREKRKRVPPPPPQAPCRLSDRFQLSRLS